MQFRKVAGPVAVALAGASVMAVAVIYVAALQLLAGGPSTSGYDLLVVANHGAVAAAVLVASAGVLLAATRGTRTVIAVLLAGFAATWAIAAGLNALGTTLANVQPAQQPEALSSMFYVMTGTSAALTPVPCILLAGAATAFLATVLRKTRQPRSALVSGIRQVRTQPLR